MAPFPTPTNVSQFKSFLGLAIQLTCFTDSLASISAPLRDLLGKQSVFSWNEDHDETVRRIKLHLTSVFNLAVYDPALPVRLESDAARLHGMGYVLLQLQKGQ